MFLNYLLNEDENSLVYKFLKVQDMNPSRNDWTVTVRKDLKFFNLSENFEEIKDMSKYSLKVKIKSEIRKKAFQELMDMRERSTKIRGEYDELKMQDYLISKELSIDEKRTVFKLRCRVTEVKRNYRNKYPLNLLCPLCGQHEDTESKLTCMKIKECLPEISSVVIQFVTAKFQL